MKRETLLGSVFAGLLAVVLVGAGGCASGPDAAGTIESMGQFGTEVAKVSDGIDAALAALEALTGAQGDDLKGSFDAYTKSVSALEEQADKVRDLASELKARGDEFFAEWEADETSEVSPERRAKLSASYGQIEQSMSAAAKDFDPFLASLKDIQKFLKLDLTRRSLGSLSDVVTEAREHGAQVKSSIGKVLENVNSVRGMLSAKPAA